MSPYREPSKPAESNRFIQLPVTRVRRFLLGPSLWFLAVWFFVFVVAGIVEPLVTGENWWKLALGLLAWPLFPFVVTRVMRLESVLIGAQSLRRVGFFRERAVRWEDVKGVRRFTRRAKNRAIPLIGVQTSAGELVIAELAVDDANGVLDWALAAASEGRTQDIEERVRSEGRDPRRPLWYVPHTAVALVLTLVLGVYLYKDQQRRFVERTLRQAEQLPLAESVATLQPIFDDEALAITTRCRAGSSLKFARARSGDGAGAFSVCARQVELGCSYLTPDECTRFAALRDAGAALEGGDATGALRLLEGWTEQGPARGAVEVPALVSLGRSDEAREASARCLAAAEESELATSALVARCRLTP